MVPELIETEVLNQTLTEDKCAGPKIIRINLAVPSRTTGTYHTLSVSRTRYPGIGSGSWGLKAPVRTNHRLQRMRLPPVVVWLSFSQHQRLLFLACEAKRPEDARDKEDLNGHKHERTGYSTCGWPFMLLWADKLEDQTHVEGSLSPFGEKSASLAHSSSSL